MSSGGISVRMGRLPEMKTTEPYSPRARAKASVKNPQSNSEGKRFVAMAAARLVQDGMVAGMGTGSTVAFVIEELARRRREEA